MPIIIEYASYHTHTRGCPRCRGADFPHQLCRIGRRLFWRYLSEMTTETRTVFILGLPDDIRAEVLRHFPTDETQIVTMQLPPTEEGEN